LREAHPELSKNGAQIVAIAPDTVANLAKHLKTNTYPYSVVADTDGSVFDAYDVTSRMISLGQQPALFIVDTAGTVRFDAIGAQQWDLISPKDLAAELKKLS
jgi:peroxiredoxin